MTAFRSFLSIIHPKWKLWFIQMAGILGISLLLTSHLKAHPISFEGGWAFMSELESKKQEISVIYSPKWWLGAGIVYDRHHNQHHNQWDLTSIHGAFLARRWNSFAAQGNFYIFGGPGYGQEKNSNSTRKEGFFRLGLQIDYETRRIYSAIRFIENRWMTDSRKIYDSLQLSWGIAPYLAGFNDLNTWFIFKLTTNVNGDNVQYTPTLRFFYQNLFWELGLSLKGDAQASFMMRL